MTKDYKTNSLRAFDFENISENIPELSLIDAELSVQSFDDPIDSSDITPSDWKRIANVIHKYYDIITASGDFIEREQFDIINHNKLTD